MLQQKTSNPPQSRENPHGPSTWLQVTRGGHCCFTHTALSSVHCDLAILFFLEEDLTSQPFCELVCPAVFSMKGAGVIQKALSTKSRELLPLGTERDALEMEGCVF